MKRYDLSDDCYAGGAGYEMMNESTDGKYVLYSEAQAEISRLRGLVVAAYLEGYADGRRNDLPARHAWECSAVYRALYPPSPTPNP